MKLTGATQEVRASGDARGLTITATLQDRRAECCVTFLKLYDRAHSGYDAVRYAGDVSDDGNEIAGRWTVPGSWSGTFLMIRSGGAATELAREAREQV